ncbi:hypothetical protein M514_04190 [Trichuris suis]|uniref:Uncharacterized protein n=1 Tax=Trichuris suis TaxID=68888 RepID=A0A085NRQ5_9BILA|nr:hypothetical protein M513_04190 [Trichuris suis]KFD72151.1 hypothetical protein M514_04190 [Trichuris suis]
MVVNHRSSSWCYAVPRGATDSNPIWPIHLCDTLGHLLSAHQWHNCQRIQSLRQSSNGAQVPEAIFQDEKQNNISIDGDF